MFDRVLKTLIASKNEAADDVLLEALRLGNERQGAFAHRRMKGQGHMGLARDEVALLAGSVGEDRARSQVPEEAGSAGLLHCSR